MRKLSMIVAAAATLALATPAAADPEFTFADCPALPTGADPAQWRCEEMAATGTFQVGRLPAVDLRGMRLTFAEGRLDGQFAQTFGALRSEESRVHGLRMRFEYAGHSDFHSNDERMGELRLNLVVNDTCTVGPIDFVMQRTAPTEVVSTDPVVVTFAIADDRFTVPESDCGHGIDQRIGLPATGELELTARVGLRSY